MGNRGRARASIVEISKEAQPLTEPASAGQSPAPDHAPFYTAALLKLAIELRRPEPRPLEESLEHILSGTPIDRDAFRGYLRRNFSLLRRA